MRERNLESAPVDAPAGDLIPRLKRRGRHTLQVVGPGEPCMKKGTGSRPPKHVKALTDANRQGRSSVPCQQGDKTNGDAREFQPNFWDHRGQPFRVWYDEARDARGNVFAVGTAGMSLKSATFVDTDGTVYKVNYANGLEPQLEKNGKTYVFRFEGVDLGRAVQIDERGWPIDLDPGQPTPGQAPDRYTPKEICTHAKVTATSWVDDEARKHARLRLGPLPVGLQEPRESVQSESFWMTLIEAEPMVDLYRLEWLETNRDSWISRIVSEFERILLSILKAGFTRAIYPAILAAATRARYSLWSDANERPRRDAIKDAARQGAELAGWRQRPFSAVGHRRFRKKYKEFLPLRKRGRPTRTDPTKCFRDDVERVIVVFERRLVTTGPSSGTRILAYLDAMATPANAKKLIAGKKSHLTARVRSGMEIMRILIVGEKDRLNGAPETDGKTQEAASIIAMEILYLADAPRQKADKRLKTVLGPTPKGSKFADRRRDLVRKNGLLRDAAVLARAYRDHYPSVTSAGKKSKRSKPRITS